METANPIKKALWIKGLDHVKAFAAANNLKPFTIAAQYADGNKGYYVPAKSHIVVDVNRTTTPVKVPGFKWSWPGNKSDVTAIGVLAHETGHHCHYQLGRALWKQMLQRADQVRAVEPAISSYEPNCGEVIAESFRLFILNPDLLKVGRPQRYKMLVDYGFKPIEKREWLQVLAGAHPKIIEANKKWIAAAL